MAGSGTTDGSESRYDLARNAFQFVQVTMRTDGDVCRAGFRYVLLGIDWQQGALFDSVHRRDGCFLAMGLQPEPG